MATDEDCKAGKVIAFPGKDRRTGEMSVYLVLITDDSRADEGSLEGVYIEAVGAEEGLFFGQYKIARYEGDEWKVSLIDDTCVDGRVSDGVHVLDLASTLASVSWVDENDAVCEYWDEWVLLTAVEWDILESELNVYMSDHM